MTCILLHREPYSEISQGSLVIFVISDCCVKMTERTLLQQYVQIAVVVAAYWFISITLGELIKKGQSLAELIG